MRILVTGGAGFIGSNFIRYMLAKYANYRIVCLDKLTYAGNLANLAEVSGSPRFSFIEGDICHPPDMGTFDVIVNFAAETHVDRSIMNPTSFLHTNILGVQAMLDYALSTSKDTLFVQISTDEVYGPIDSGGFSEADCLNPRNPYAASKAAAEMLVNSYHNTFGTNIRITRGTNTYGPFQFPEKLIPLFVTNMIEDKALPIYGSGMQLRTWLHVWDHCTAIDCVIQHGKPGGTYNVSFESEERTNLDITRFILKAFERDEDTYTEHVADRPGHDSRYSIHCSKIMDDLGWRPVWTIERGLNDTIEWYKGNRDWWEPLKKAQKEYFKQQYQRD